MLTKIKDAINNYSMLENSNDVIVALSGGADSVALFHSLLMLSDELNINISACHLNHNLRGGESLRDQEFVLDLCNKYNVPLNLKSVDILSLCKKHISVEETARNERYTFFEEIANGKLIATAHTASDNTETVLINLIRGSVLRGLCGIPPIRGNIIRPLINCTRDEVENYCSENNLLYMTDSSNLSDEYTRNNIRINVIPILKKINPSIHRGIAKMTEELRQDENFMTNEAISIIESCKIGEKFKADILAKTSSPLLHRIIATILSQNNISPSSLMIYEIEKILKIGMGKINIKKNHFAIVKKNFFYIEKIHQNYRK